MFTPLTVMLAILGVVAVPVMLGLYVIWMKLPAMLAAFPGRAR